MMNIKISGHKTKIVCTIGPASRSKGVLKDLILSGMNVARLNFSHGDLTQHAKDIETIRDVAAGISKPVTILADLPGPKIRIGLLKDGSCILKKGEKVVLTTKEVEGTASLIPVQFREFIGSIGKGSKIFLNDGFIQLKVVSISGEDATCRVIIGGHLLSHKGLNLPDARITINPITRRDLELVDFGLKQGVHIFCASFVKDAKDIRALKDYARQKGENIFVIAKIERTDALGNIDEILSAADAIMIARGDLGVEVPIEKVPVIQKHLIMKANHAAKPVITATQMLESMTENIRPTRAEVTDVANAILDGTDAVMLSEETAIGSYPADAAKMLVKVARITEKERDSLVSGTSVRDAMVYAVEHDRASTIEDALSLDVIRSLHSLDIRYVLAPTLFGGTPRRISRFKGRSWILAFCNDVSVMNFLTLSYGVYPVHLDRTDSDYAIMLFLKEHKIIKSGDKIIMLRRLPDEEIGRANSFKIIVLD